MTRLLLAALHNGELSSSPAQAVVEALENTFDVMEVFEQPAITTEVDLSELTTWAARQWELEKLWRTYLRQESWLRDVQAHLGYAAWRARIAASPNQRAAAWRIRQIETFVSAKHAVAWRAFVAGDQEILMVAESDATLRTGSVAHIAAISELVEPQELWYVNVAGGLDPMALKLDALRSESGELGHLYDRPVSNTSCAYLVTKPMARMILDYLDRYPFDARLGIDWIFNAVFLDAARRGARIMCLHADPPAVGHGSRTGVTQSWHSGR